MLSEETAISNKWRKIIIWLNKFLILKRKKLLIENDENIFWKAVDLVKDYTLVVFTKKGLMLDKVFKKSVKNDVFVFTDMQKTKSISNFYKNAKCFLTKKIDDTIFIPLGAVHRIENPSNKPVKIIEAQVGSILKESDIVRFQDVYGRIK
jgi:hypothetical protein